MANQVDREGLQPLDLEAIKARERGATAGPWTYGWDGISGCCFVPEVAASDSPHGYGPDLKSDAAFIAHARADIPALIAEVERLRAALQGSVASPQEPASHLRVLQACAAGDCSDPECCVEWKPETLCARCRAKVYLQSLDGPVVTADHIRELYEAESSLASLLPIKWAGSGATTPAPQQEKAMETTAPNPISPSETDCTKWAASFVEHVHWKPSIATDEGTMMAWFATAIMAGFDQAQRKRDVEIREFIGWLSADIPELHHVEIPRLHESYKTFLNTRDPDSKEAREYAAHCSPSPAERSQEGETP